jgi:Beta-lactamase enzyme family
MIRPLSTGAKPKAKLHRLVAVVVGVGLLLGACTSSSRSSSAPQPPASAATTTTTPPAWAKFDRALARLGTRVGFVAARVAPEGTCQPVHQIASSTVRPTASQFKLFVLGALANQIAAGRISWDQTLTVQDAVKSVGNGQGSFQLLAAGTKVSVEEAATKMISISDNTAADMLIALVGREQVEEQVRQWAPATAPANEPFLTTREMFLLHYAKGLGNRYLATPAGQRRTFLASSVDPLPLTALASGYSTDPRYVEKIEWFASPEDICRAFAGLQMLSKNPQLSPLSTVLSRQLGTIGLQSSDWPTVWFKGGSEPGVLTLGWLATNSRGETFVVEAMVSNPKAALSADSITKLVSLARRAFGLLG